MRRLKARDLARPRFKADPYPFYAKLRAEAPVCRVRAFHAQAWLVTRYDDVVTVLKDDRFGKDISARMRWLPRFSRPLTHNMLNRDPPDHTRLRTLVTRAFTARRVELLREQVTEWCNRSLRAIPEGEPFDLLASYALPLPLVVISEMLGIPPEDRRRFHAATRGSLPLGAPTGLTDVPRALPHAWRLLRFFRKLFAERRARPQDDLISALVQAEAEGDRLNEEELLGMGILLLLAGYETTVNLIASGVLALLRHPDQRERFLEDSRVRDSAIQELLRYTSPVDMASPRVVREEVTLASTPLRPGDWVVAVLGAANRDPSRFDEPDRFDVAREPNPHVAFGQGAHYCLGAQLAQMEAQLALTMLFRRFPDLKLAVPAESLRWRRVLPLRALEALPVVGRSGIEG